MTGYVIAKFEELEADVLALFAKAKASPIVATAITDIEEIGSATINYIKSNGLQAVYTLALDLLPILVGQSWGTVLAKLRTDAIAAGHVLIDGSEAIIASQAQADLIAAGKLLGPVTVAA